MTHNANAFHETRFDALGTQCHVIYDCHRTKDALDFGRILTAWVRDFEAKYSRFRPDSIISRLNDRAGLDWVPIDRDLEQLFALCDWFHWVTHGMFDPTSLPLTRLWDYHAPPAAVPSPRTVADALARVGWTRVQREPGRARLPEKGMALELGGIGKEYAVDRVADMAACRGIRNLLVNFGNDVRVSGEAPQGGPWYIGLEHPQEPDHCWGGIALTDRAIASSGDYRRHVVIDGVRYGHIIDPRTGRPARNGVTMVSAIAPTCVEAGISAKAAFILGPEDGPHFLAQRPHVEGCVMTGNNVIETGGFHRYELNRLSSV